MVNLTALKTMIDDSGISFTRLAENTGMSRETLYRKLEGETEFKVSEIYALSVSLKMTMTERDEIFFCKNVS